MSFCTCRECREEARRAWEERRREACERHQREQANAYERKHGPLPTVDDIMRRMGLR